METFSSNYLEGPIFVACNMRWFYIHFFFKGKTCNLVFVSFKIMNSVKGIEFLTNFGI